MIHLNLVLNILNERSNDWDQFIKKYKYINKKCLSFACKLMYQDVSIVIDLGWPGDKLARYNSSVFKSKVSRHLLDILDFENDLLSEANYLKSSEVRGILDGEGITLKFLFWDHSQKIMIYSSIYKGLRA